MFGVWNLREKVYRSPPSKKVYLINLISSPSPTRDKNFLNYTYTDSPFFTGETSNNSSISLFLSLLLLVFIDITSLVYIDEMKRSVIYR